jgi:hypothetical protein
VRRFAWDQAARAALLSGSAASLLSSLALAWRGRREVHDAAAPLNGPSQWVWGTQAPYARGFSVRHTVVGYAIHHVASIFWALAYERCRPKAARPASAVAAAVAIAATASFVDYRLTPKRLEPGFDKRLSRSSLVLVYAAFAAGLAAATLAGLSRRR